MPPALKLVPRAPAEDRDVDLAARVRELEQEREQLLELLAQQQRVAQAGLITSGLAHDVNNHIQAIAGVSFLALQHKQPEDWYEALEKVQSQCCDLTETTRAFLGFVRRRDNTGLQTFRAAQAITDTYRLTKPLAHRHTVALGHTCVENVVIEGEQRLLIQAIVNLVTNAVRACAGRDEPKVGIAALRPTPSICRFEVSDNGPGIPPTLRRRLFRPFASGNEDKGGNGLGLFIVRQNVRRLGGTIRVRSSDEGTTFQIDLPCRE